MHLTTFDFSELVPVIISATPPALIIIVGAVALNMLLSRALAVVARRTHFTEQEIGPVRRAIKWMIGVAALVFVLGAFGFNVAGMWGVFSTVFAMVAIGFVAVWSVLSNTLCTLMIMLFRPFGVGDEVEFTGEPVKGRVIDLNFIYTTLDADDGSVLQVPNNLFFQKVVRRRRNSAGVSPAVHMRTKSPQTSDALPTAAIAGPPVR